jgi:O-antigen/teichoic acid export membrane protein
VTVKSAIFSLSPPFLRRYLERIQASHLGYRLAKGIFWSMAGAVISRGLMLLASILVARILGREVYGEFGMIRSTVSMFVVFAGFGLGMTATKHVAEFRDRDPARAGRVMAISGLFATATGLLVAATVFLSAPWLAAKTINAPHLAGELRIGAIILFLDALNGAQTGALAGFEAFQSIAKVNLWVGLASFPLLVCGVYWGGLRGGVIALTANMAVNWVLNHLALRKEASRYRVPFTLKECTRELPILWKFSVPAALSGFMVSPVMWACNAFLVNQPDGYGQMGIFNAADQWRVAVLFIPATISQIALPMLSSLNGLDDRLRYRKVLKYNMILNGGMGLAGATLISIAAPWIMRSYGEAFESGGWVLACLVFSAVLIALNQVIGQAIVSKGKMWAAFYLNLLWGGTLLACSIWFISRKHGAMGLAMAYLLAYILHTLWVSIYTWRSLKSY